MPYYIEDPLGLLCTSHVSSSDRYEFLQNDISISTRFYRWVKKTKKQWNIEEEKLIITIVVFIVSNAIWCKWTLNVKEDIFILRNILHWILTPLTLIALSLVQLWSYIVLAVQGKKACIHKLAGKATLAQVDSVA
ncbi:unnamed protein product [Rotaria sp. Silwood1]|nr:unnamed protein product [Rotaria sp. Silwood1]